MENEIENTDSTNGEDVEETTEDSQDTEDTQDSSETVESLKEKNQSLYEQLQKAKGKVRDANGNWVKKPETTVTEKKPAQTTSTAQLSQTDLLYIARTDIHEDDIEEVKNYASKNGLSVKEAHAYLKPILAVKDEKRKTATAANTGNVRRNSTKLSNETILQKARNGESVDPEALAEALIEEKKSKAKR